MLNHDNYLVSGEGRVSLLCIFGKAWCFLVIVGCGLSVAEHSIALEEFG